MKRQMYLLPLLLLWAGLTAAAWLWPEQEISQSERRPLAQFPEVSLESVLDGGFMEDFESYSLDQFPFRDGFRRIKSLFHLYVLGQKDNNGIYLFDGYAADQEYPLNKASVDRALERFNHLKDTYLADAQVFMAVVPDKNYYLAQRAGQLAMDYDELFERVQAGMPWADHIDLTEVLTIEDYYRTDTHWRQERLIPAAQRICAALGVRAPELEDYTQTVLERPFYGVYYGQAALPMEPDSLVLMESSLLEQCAVYDYETGKSGAVYDMTKLTSRDLYDVYLSGARSLLTIENPQAHTDRELLIFRDSFGSSLAPLLVSDYAKVTLIDLRYISSDLLADYVPYTGQDVLMIYSSLILNNSGVLR